MKSSTFRNIRLQKLPLRDASPTESFFLGNRINLLLPSCHHSCLILKQALVSGFPGCSRCCLTVSVARGLPTIDIGTLLLETSPYPWEEWNISRRGGNKRELLAWLGSLLSDSENREPPRPLDGRSFILCWLPHRMNLLTSSSGPSLSNKSHSLN